MKDSKNIKEDSDIRHIIDLDLNPELQNKKGYFRNKYDRIMFQSKIFKRNNKFKSDPLFFWSNQDKKIKKVDEKFIELELNFKIPEETIYLSREKTITYSKYYIKELLTHLNYSLYLKDDKVTKAFQNLLVMKKLKTYIFDPLILLSGYLMIKSFFNIFKNKPFIAKTFYTPIFCYIFLKTISIVQNYFMYVAHFNFMINEVLLQENSIPLEKEYQEYLIFKTKLYIFERNRVTKTKTVHPIEINEDKDLLFSSESSKPIF